MRDGVISARQPIEYTRHLKKNPIFYTSLFLPGVQSHFLVPYKGALAHWTGSPAAKNVEG